MEAKLSEVEVINLSEDGEQILTFEYPLRGRLSMIIPLCMIVGLYVFILLPITFLSLAETISGRVILEGSEGPDGLFEFLLLIFVPIIMIFHGYMINLAFPDVQLKSDGFRISRLFYTSQWFNWQDIYSIKKNPITNWLLTGSRKRVVSITVAGLPKRYFSVIGAFMLQADKEGFLVTNSIENYKELLEFFRAKRPDLFEGEDE